MGKLIYQIPQDYFVKVSICSVNSFISFNPLRINIDEINLQKVDFILENSIGSNFLLFPEYTYSEALREKYQTFCNLHNCIIIGGSGLEAKDENFYAFSPVFLPNEEIIKVYKKHITNEERIHSEGKIIPYPNEVQRQIRINGAENDILFSVFVCYDFIVENKDSSNRADIVFVPQYEKSPELFINEGDRISKGMQNFVLGANTSNDEQRSLGFAILNNAIINALAGRGWRQPNYLDGGGAQLRYHHTTIYDSTGERLLKFEINIGRPFSFPSTFSLVDAEPIIIPIDEKNIQ